MKPSASLIGLASVAAYLVLGTHGFVAPGSLTAGGVISRTHDVSSSIISCGRGSRSVFPASDHASPRHRNEHSSLTMMAAGKKRRRRKGGKGSATAAASGVSTAPKKQPASAAPVVAGGGAGQLGDVLEGDRGVEELFSDDWSDMPANTGMVKSNVSSLCCPGRHRYYLCRPAPQQECKFGLHRVTAAHIPTSR